MSLAFDAANPAISIAEMVQHGAIVAPVYIRGNPGGFQPSDAARVAALRKAGLAPWPNWESTADFFQHCSLAEAKAAGVEARESALRLGFPDDGTISVPFSFDYQAAAGTFLGCLARLKAARDGLGDGYIATSYAQSSLIQYFGHAGFTSGHWLMASTWQSTSSIAQPSSVYDIGSPFVAMVQSHHADGSWFTTPIPGTDVNTVTRPDILAAWWPDDSPFGADMLNQADIDTLIRNLKQEPIDPNGRTVAGALRQIDDIEAKVDALKAQVAAQQTAAVNVEALVNELVPGLVAALGPALAPAVAHELVVRARKS